MRLLTTIFLPFTQASRIKNISLRISIQHHLFNFRNADIDLEKKVCTNNAIKKTKQYLSQHDEEYQWRRNRDFTELHRPPNLDIYTSTSTSRQALNNFHLPVLQANTSFYSFVATFLSNSIRASRSLSDDPSLGCSIYDVITASLTHPPQWARCLLMT